MAMAMTRKVKIMTSLFLAVLILTSIFFLCFQNIDEATAQDINNSTFATRLGGGWGQDDYSGSTPTYSRSYGYPYNSTSTTYNHNNLSDFFDVYIKSKSVQLFGDSNWLKSNEMIDKMSFFDIAILFKYPHRYKVANITVQKNGVIFCEKTADADWQKDTKQVNVLAECGKSGEIPNGKYQVFVDYIVDDGACTAHDGVGYFSLSYRSDIFSIDNGENGATLKGVTNGGITNGKVSINWTNVGARANYENGSSYTRETEIINEGEYTIIYYDIFERLTKFTFTIDKTAPSGTLGGVTNGGHTKNDVTFSWTDGKAKATLDTKDFANGAVISSEGAHTLELVDTAGNKSTYYFTIDKTAMNKDNVEIVGANKVNGKFYTCQKIVAKVKESNITKIKYRKREVSPTNFVVEDIDKFAIDNTTQNEGEWELIFVDWCDNDSAIVTVTMQIVTDFGNINNIKNSYTLTAFYKVNLPSYVFGATGSLPNIANIYSFEKYEDALKWCIAKEFEYRVRPQVGSWIYISANNESVAQTYTDKSQLDQVIQKYASRYVSTRQIYKNSAIDFGIIMRADGKADPNYFARQNNTLPTFLSSYKALPFFQINKSFVFKRLNALLSECNVKMTYIANDIQTDVEKTFSIEYNYSIKDSLTKELAQIKQGYYKVSESDLCGNEQTYIVHIDNGAPKMQVETTRGDGVKSVITFDEDTIKSLEGTLYYMSLRPLDILDNVDEFVGLKIVGGKLDDYYLKGDAMPLLNASSTGAGQYTFRLYDRSNNILEFSVFIAGKEVSWEYSSLKPTAESVRIYFYINDRNNSIKSLSIFKIKGNGDTLALNADSNGVAINFMTLTYEFKDGGKYSAQIVDLFGRTTKFEAIFFQKGLPVGILSVGEREATNKDVTFQYESGYELIVYVWTDGVKKVWTNYFKEYNNNTQRFTVTFTADIQHSQQYTLYLYSTADKEMFIEYYFEIDTILADFTIKDLNGAPIERDGATNKGFVMDWSEDGIRIQYSTASTTSGTYSRGVKLVANGKYTITVRDKVGNTATFSIYVDTVVSYEIEGNYTNNDGVYITNQKIKVNVTENFTEFSVNSANGYIFGNDSPILIEGKYQITIKDKYNNIIVLDIIVDFTPPTVEVKGLTQGATKGEVVIVFESGASAELYKDGRTFIKAITSGESFGTHGTYEVRVSDIAGNVSKQSFGIDRIVEFTCDVIDRQITSDKVNLDYVEPTQSVQVTLDGVEQKYEGAPKSFILQGKYVVTIIDKIGNSATLSFVIKNKMAKTQEITREEGVTIKSCKKDGIVYSVVGDKMTDNGTYELEISDSKLGKTYILTLIVDNVPPTVDIVIKKSVATLKNFSKENCKMQLYKNGIEIECSQSMTIKEVGKYKLVIVDDIGNLSEYEFEIKFRMTGWTLALIFLAIGLMALVIGLIVRTRKFRVS